jgi:GDPmannose 4,6-dehydratase
MSESLAVNTNAFASLLESISQHTPATRVVYASSCRVFGFGDGTLLNESSIRHPACPYGISKAAGMSVCELFRRERGLFVSSAILFNHESELRGETFLSRRLTVAALAARKNKTYKIFVESLDDAADWGSARDYASAMRSIASADIAEDFVVASGRLRRVRDLAESIFAAVGLDWTNHVAHAAADPSRPRWRLAGDSSKLMSRTGWKAMFDFDEMATDLVTRTERYGRERPADFHSYL